VELRPAEGLIDFACPYPIHEPVSIFVASILTAQENLKKEQPSFLGYSFFLHLLLPSSLLARCSILSQPSIANATIIWPLQ
jgi:hypothetical protein